jgi:hypothetical protein
MSLAVSLFLEAALLLVVSLFLEAVICLGAIMYLGINLSWGNQYVGTYTETPLGTFEFVNSLPYLYFLVRVTAYTEERVHPCCPVVYILY